MYRLYFIIIAFAFYACQSSENGKGRHDFGYPHIGQLFKDQEAILLSNECGLQKTALLNKQREEVTILPNDALWSKELSAFQEIDLNRPSYLGFITKDSVIDENGRIITYTATKASIPIKKLIVHYDKEGNINNLDCNTEKENEISKTEKTLSAHFNTQNGKSILTDYDIVSTQKMILKDPIYTSIHGVVLNK
jgi:hypothetical protein